MRGGEGDIATNLTSTIRDLHRRKARGRRGLALVEGVRLTEEALAAGLKVRGAVCSSDLKRTIRGAALKAQLESGGIPVQDVSAKMLLELADTDTPQGIIAVVEPRLWTAADFPSSGSTFLVIDGVQDPGNVGTLIRTAHALGADGTVVLPGTADIWSAKVLRAAMGATFRHPVAQHDDGSFIAWSREHRVTLWATASDGRPLPDVLAMRTVPRSPDPIAVIVGNEGAGIRPQLAAVTSVRVAIPMVPGAESLNVGVAAGILLYEVQRGR